MGQLHINIETNIFQLYLQQFKNTKEELEKMKADSITLVSVNLILCRPWSNLTVFLRQLKKWLRKDKKTPKQPKLFNMTH